MSEYNAKNELVNGQPTNMDFLLSEESWHNQKVYYITDIHIEHHVPKNEISEFNIDPKPFITKYIRKLLNIPDKQEKICKEFHYLLIGGDVADSFEVIKAFYEILCEYWFKRRIVAILGNHELWDCPGKTTHEKSDSYRDLFQSLGINYLHNSLLLLNISKPCVLSEKTLVSMDEDDLRARCVRFPLIILGGLGFSGLNPQYNGDNIEYGDTISNRKQDMEQTIRFSNIYKRVNSIIGDIPVIVFTHTPFSDWCDMPYNKNWIYVNGHNHINTMIREEARTVYSDNQVGYDELNPQLKFFTISDLIDIFHYYKDGIHEITAEDYMEFNRCLGIHMAPFKRKGKIHMIKSSGRYMFFYEDTAKRKGYFYILNGGLITATRHQNLEYFVVNMPHYAQAIENAVAPYYKALKSVSDHVKQFGGSGYIHGSIIDIDFYNHIYLNPLDGKATPYYATDMSNKYVYKSVAMLLKEKNPKLYENLRLLTSDDNPLIVYENNEQNSSDNEPDFVADTDIYRMSRVIKSLQYISKANVIRLWDEGLLSSITNSKRLNNHDKLSLQGVEA